MRLLVLVHRSARELVTDVQTHSENTGIGALGVNLGNKVQSPSPSPTGREPGQQGAVPGR
jgi:hypothetical protein